MCFSSGFDLIPYDAHAVRFEFDARHIEFDARFGLLCGSMELHRNNIGNQATISLLILHVYLDVIRKQSIPGGSTESVLDPHSFLSLRADLPHTNSNPMS